MQSGLWAERSAGDRRSCKRFPDWWAALRRSIPDRPASQDGDKYGCFSIGIGFCDAERSLSGEKHRRPLLLQTFSDRRAVLRRSIHRARQDQKERSAAIFQREAGFARPAAFGAERSADGVFSAGASVFPKSRQRQRGGLRRQCSGRPLGAAQMGREPPQRRISADAAPAMSGKPRPLCFWGAGKTAMAGSGSEAEPHAIFVFKGRLRMWFPPQAGSGQYSAAAPLCQIVSERKASV